MKSLTQNQNLNGRNRPLNISKSERDLIAAAVGERSLRDAAMWLNENLPLVFQRSYMAVSNWVNGVNQPDDVFIHALATYYDQEDPRHQLAADILALREHAARLTHA